MSEGIPYADIIILALVAGFILLRLRSILGTKNEGETPDFMKRMSAVQSPVPALADSLVQPPSSKPKPKDEPDAYWATLPDGNVRTTLAEIQSKEPQFFPTSFLQGAKAAFEMVFDAFGKGDQATLKMLMSESIFTHFNTEITARTAQPDRKIEVTLVSVIAKDITDAVLVNSKVQLTVHFISEQVNLVRNANNDIIEGNPSELQQVEDHWVFERDLTSKNPNWKIIET